ncbi:hypothetical protein [Variovorax sp. tm]|jgi:hypothetical protein|uniref:hypothetical protein n=1 Tax=Variovorax atrisoli TaxID=3394203 RepID=UPI003A7FF531
MKNDSVNPSPIRSTTGQQLQCNVVVEPSSIDFLNEGSIFAAGSSNDCSAISPFPEPKKSKRRGQENSER